MKLIYKINRISAWVLAFCFIAFMITGFDMQLRFLSPKITSRLHLNYLFFIAQISFMIHTTYAFHNSLKIRKRWNLLGKILLGLYFALNLSLVVVFLIIQLR